MEGCVFLLFPLFPCLRWSVSTRDRGTGAIQYGVEREENGERVIEKERKRKGTSTHAAARKRWRGKEKCNYLFVCFWWGVEKETVFPHSDKYCAIARYIGKI